MGGGEAESMALFYWGQSLSLSVLGVRLLLVAFSQEGARPSHSMGASWGYPQVWARKALLALAARNDSAISPGIQIAFTPLLLYCSSEDKGRGLPLLVI